MSHRLHKGMVIDGFTIGERLHRGGMAELWAVTKPGLDLPMLMKVPFLREGDDPTAIVGFEMEQMILPRLTGPHVPRFVALGDLADEPHIVMERVPGDSLRPLLDQTPLPIAQVAKLGAKVATALNELHRQHVIHLDIKPSNVIIRPGGEACLVDFGLSRHDELPDLLAEEFRLPMGTGPYISPEQVLRVRSEPRSDLFALGVMLYFMATAKRPFGKPERIGGLKRRLWRDPAPPRAIRPDIPPWFQEVVLRCLEVDPAERYPTAAQLAFDLMHPAEVKLTARAERRHRDGVLTATKRWFASIGREPRHVPSVMQQIATSPIVMAAIDLSPETEPLSEALRVMVQRLIRTMPEARLACVHVLRTHTMGLDSTLDAEGRNIHLQRLVELKHWAAPLGIAADMLTFHVLEAGDTAAAIIDYARVNHVDQIILGARGASAMRRYLGSVSSQVVANAPCTVTVVRLSENDGQASHPPK